MLTNKNTGFHILSFYYYKKSRLDSNSFSRFLKVFVAFLLFSVRFFVRSVKSTCIVPNMEGLNSFFCSNNLDADLAELSGEEVRELLESVGIENPRTTERQLRGTLKQFILNRRFSPKCR